MKTLVLIVVAALAAPWWSGAAVVIWQEDFSDVSDWFVIDDPGGGSSISSDGSLGAFYVNDDNNNASFGPRNDGSAPFVPFDPARKSLYALAFTVDHLTWSTSYQITLDEFGINSNYLNTVWNVFPTQYTTTVTGYTNINLGAYAFDPATAFLMPKIVVYTGDGAQTTYFDSMEFEEASIPEPDPLLLTLLGLASVRYATRRRRAADGGLSRPQRRTGRGRRPI